MNKMISSDFVEKITKKMSEAIISDNHLSKEYLKKWNIAPQDIVNQLSSAGLHGGIYSKVKSLNNLKIDENLTVLNIGPETGFEVFLLAELFGRVIVCDPDEDNLILLKKIACAYQTEAGIPASEKITFLPLGINNSDTFSEEKRIYNSLKQFGCNSMPTFYNVTSKKEISDLQIPVDLVFIHKILSTITRSASLKSEVVFSNAVQTLRTLLNKGGKISWTEPKAVWEQKKVDLSLYEGLIYEYELQKLEDTYIQIVI